MNYTLFYRIGQITYNANSSDWPDTAQTLVLPGIAFVVGLPTPQPLYNKKMFNKINNRGRFNLQNTTKTNLNLDSALRKKCFNV